MSESVPPAVVSLSEGVGGYRILVDGADVGLIEGVPGRIEYMVVEQPWQGRGVGRAALNEFLRLSAAAGEGEVRTNNATSEAMRYILQTEGFEERDGGSAWVAEV